MHNQMDALFLYVDGRYLLKGDQSMGQIYESRKDRDGFLYLTYVEEMAFGA